MKIGSRLFLILWSCAMVLAGIVLGGLLLQAVTPVSAEEAGNSGSSEGAPDQATAQVFVPDEFIHRAAAAAQPPPQLKITPQGTNHHKNKKLLE
jgi:hypothetical protein